MRAEIEPNATARTREFPPALARFRTIAVVVRLEVRDLAQCATCEHRAQSEKVRVPAATLKNGEQSATVLGQGGQFGCFRDSIGEGLVHNDVLTGVERFAREIEMGDIRGGDHDQINFRKSKG